MSGTSNDDELVAAVSAMKVDNPEQTVKELHKQLLSKPEWAGKLLFSDVKRALKRAAASARVTDKLPTQLMHAIGRGDNVAVSRWLDSGGDVDSKTDDNGTLLMLASAVCNMRLVEKLLHRGAAIDLQDTSGSSALHYAAFIGSAPLVRLLLSAGALVVLRNGDGLTALQIAQRDRLTDCVKAFKEHLSPEKWDLAEACSGRPTVDSLLSAPFTDMAATLRNFSDDVKLLACCACALNKRMLDLAPVANADDITASDLRFAAVRGEIRRVEIRDGPGTEMHEATKKTKSRICRAGCVSALVSGMRKHVNAKHSNAEDLQIQGVEALSMIAAGSADHKKQIVDAGGVDVTAAAMRAYPDCYRVQRGGCVLLCNLAALDDYVEAARAVGGAELVQAAISMCQEGDSLITYANRMRPRLIRWGDGQHEQRMATRQKARDAGRVLHSLQGGEAFINLGKACALCGVLPPGWPPRSMVRHDPRNESLQPLYQEVLPGTGPGEEEAPIDSGWKACSKCKVVRYCCREHQKEAWKMGHKHSCGQLLPSRSKLPTGTVDLLRVFREFAGAHAGLAYSCASALLLRDIPSEDREAIRAVAAKFDFTDTLPVRP
jgi:hypothetical protein